MVIDLLPAMARTSHGTCSTFANCVCYAPPRVISSLLWQYIESIMHPQWQYHSRNISVDLLRSEIGPRFHFFPNLWPVKTYSRYSQKYSWTFLSVYIFNFQICEVQHLYKQTTVCIIIYYSMWRSKQNRKRGLWNNVQLWWILARRSQRHSFSSESKISNLVHFKISFPPKKVVRLYDARNRLFFREFT